MNAHVSTVDRRRAGLVSRVTADLIDAVVVCLATATIVVVASMLRALFVGSVFALPDLRGAGTLGALSFVYLVYLVFFWTSTGRTPGKQVAGLRVVTSHGERLGIARATARAVLCIVFPAGLLWVMVSARNRAVHDALVGTAVVYDWYARSPGSPEPAPS